jgi:cell fate (sporulation/competence/biofilm development) regulator YmcA (YheA/YmcA/DUF963 family)
MECTFDKACSFRMTTGSFGKNFQERLQEIEEPRFLKKMVMMVKEYRKYKKQVANFKAYQKTVGAKPKFKFETLSMAS